jgi:hypothetical protein
MNASGAFPEPQLLVQVDVAADDPAALAGLVAGLGPGPFAAILCFVSPDADWPTLLPQLAQAFPNNPVIGCTTAGEIAAQGYAESRIVAIGLPGRHFAAGVHLIENLHHIDRQALIAQTIRGRQGLQIAWPDFPNEFAFLMVDGLSTREDELAAALAMGLGPVPLFGGSAGDGIRFGQTFVFHAGQAYQDAAVLILVRTTCRTRVFSLDHLRPTERRMVVTGADPATRRVHQLNAEPAALEYARLLGKDPAQLTAFTFAAHPLVVRIGGAHHVRAIQQVAPNGDLIFYSAIDEGLVLTLAEPDNMVTHLAQGLADLCAGGPPGAILATDCILRRMEAQEKQMTGAISDLLRQHGVRGFSTYGEQLNAMHVNQTMTGVALYPPEGAAG